MKQILSFLLFFIILNSLSCELLAISYNEKSDFTTGVKRGDTWNMGVNVPVSPLNIDVNNKNLLHVKALKNILAKSDWHVECLKVSKNGMLLKYTLQRLKVQADFPMKDWNRGNNIVPTLFNDTQYPIYTSETEKINIQNLVGKSFVYSWTIDSEQPLGEIRDNEFADCKMDLKLHNVSNAKGMQFKLTFNIDTYQLVGPLRICYFSNLFNAIQSESGNKQQVKFDTKDGKNIIQDTFNYTPFEINENMICLKAKRDSNKIFINRETNMPFVYGNEECFLYNFPYFKNTQVSGNTGIEDLEGQATFIFYNSRIKEDKIAEIKNGKFKLNLDVSEPELIQLKIEGKKDIYFYLKPGMQISLNWNFEKKLPRVTGFGAADVECAFKCMNVYRPGEYQPYNELLFKNISKKRKLIINEYADKISDDIFEFIKRDFDYKRGFCMAHYKFVEIPGGNFKKALETLPLVGFYSEQLPAYQRFILQYRELKQREIIELNGTTLNFDNYQENIQFAKLMYKGYPQYMSVFRILERGLLAGEIDLIKQYYDDFMNYPAADSLKKRLCKIYNNIKTIECGQDLPILEFDDFEKGKIRIPEGEFTILNIDFSNINENSVFETPLKEINSFVEKDERVDKINVFIIRCEEAKGNLNEFYFGNLNLKYVYVPKKSIESLKPLNLKNNKRRIFLLDKKLKIIDSNFNSPYLNSRSKLPKIVDEYFESLNQPKQKADTRRLLLVILASLIIFGLLSWIIIRIRTKQIAKREAAKRKLSELELRAIRSQMNPHFMFNSLNSIQNLVNKNKIEETNIYLSEFADMMRLVLNNSEKKLVPLEEELQLIQSYLELEKLRIPFDFEISVEPSIDPSEEEIPGMLIQPFVENAVVHGIAPQKGGVIKVAFTKNNDKIICNISDDGIGISTRSEQRNGNGKAIKMVHERINIVNSQTQEPLTLVVSDRKELGEKGTLVKIEIPV